MSTGRAVVVVMVLLAATAVTRAARNTHPPAPAALTELPFTIGAWKGVEGAPIDPATRQELAADAYVTRTYSAGSAAPVDLYIAYYAQQRPNVSIHSPLHCLPGTGWEPLDVSTVAIPRGDGSIAEARRMVIRKSLERAVVLYWYDVHGRMLASELSSKLWLLHDSLRFGRSDAALVRVSVPIGPSPAAADAASVAFARALLPHVSF